MCHTGFRTARRRSCSRSVLSLSGRRRCPSSVVAHVLFVHFPPDFFFHEFLPSFCALISPFFDRPGHGHAFPSDAGHRGRHLRHALRRLLHLLRPKATHRPHVQTKTQGPKSQGQEAGHIKRASVSVSGS